MWTHTLSVVVRLLLCSHSDSCCCSSSSFRSLSGFLWLMWKMIWSLFSSCCRICSVLNSTLWLRYSASHEETTIKNLSTSCWITSQVQILPHNCSGFFVFLEFNVQVCIQNRMRLSCLTLSPIQLLLCLWIVTLVDQWKDLKYIRTHCL